MSIVFQTKCVPRVLFRLVQNNWQNKIDQKRRTSHPLMLHVISNENKIRLKSAFCATETEGILCLAFNRGI